MIKLTKTPILPNYRVLNGYFCSYLLLCSAFGCSHFCVSFSHERKSEGIEIFFYHKIPTLVGKEPLEDGDYFEQEHLSFFSLLGIFILICIGCYFMMKYCRHKRRQWRNRILPNRKSRLLPKTSVSSSVSASVNSGTSLTSSVKNNV